MAKLIKNGTIVTAADQYQADVLVEGGIITQIGLNLAVDGAEVIDAAGHYVFPGGIDPHTHLEMPFGGTVTADDFETGTIAAAFGGTTTVIDFCLTNKVFLLVILFKPGIRKRLARRSSTTAST